MRSGCPQMFLTARDEAFPSYIEVSSSGHRSVENVYRQHLHMNGFAKHGNVLLMSHGVVHTMSACGNILNSLNCKKGGTLSVCRYSGIRVCLPLKIQNI